MSEAPEAEPGPFERALGRVTVLRVLIVLSLLVGGRMIAQDLYGMPPGTPCDPADARRLKLLMCQGRWLGGRCADVGADRYCTYRCDGDADCPAGWRCGMLTSITGEIYDRHPYCVGPPGADPAEAPMRMPWSD